jgi:hypothetical protein
VSVRNRASLAQPPEAECSATNHLEMKPHILLRTASILTLIHALLHHFGGLTRPPSHGQDEVVVRTAMKSFRMDVMGSFRSYWDFYFGFGLFLTVSLLLLAVLLWQLAALAKSDPAKAGPLESPRLAPSSCPGRRPALSSAGGFVTSDQEVSRSFVAAQNSPSHTVQRKVR